jgi:hypothetical protein
VTGTKDDVKTDGRGEMKEPRDDGTTAFGWDDRFARTMEAKQIQTSLVQTRWKMEERSAGKMVTSLRSQGTGHRVHKRPRDEVKTD